MSNGEFEGIAFAAGSVKGLRAWNVDKFGRLHGVSSPKVWRPGENVSACSRGIEHKDGAVPERCACGFWAYYAGQKNRYGGEVTGVIEGYGVTQLGTKGFRAEKGKIVALVLPKARFGPISRLGLSLVRGAADSVALFLGFWVAVFGLIAVAICLPIFLGGGWNTASFAASMLSISATATWSRGIYLDNSPGYSNPARGNVLRERSATNALIRRNYPDVKFYRSTKAMLRKHPVDKAPEPVVPTPDDEGFWEMDEGKTIDAYVQVQASAQAFNTAVRRALGSIR